MDLASVVSGVLRFLTTTAGVVTSLGVGGLLAATASKTVRKRLFGSGLDRFARRLYRRRRVPDTLAAALMDGDPVDVTDHGFTWLPPERFTDDSDVDPEACWRREFRFAEIHRGFAADRVSPDQESGSLTTELVEKLRDGGARVVLGAPGAGKSTLVRQVAEQWRMGEDGEEGVGRVLYRDRGSGAQITDTDELAAAIRRTPEPVLVIVSDATRRPHLPVFTLLDEFADDEEVSFLFDSRETEWDDGITETARRLADDDTDADMVAPDSNRWGDIIAAKNNLDTVSLGGLTATETEWVIDSFERATGQSVRMDPERIHDRITDDNQASAMLLLSYFFPVGHPVVDWSNSEFSLERHVAEVYNDVTPDGPETGLSAADRLRRQTAIGVNVLNAAGFTVREQSLLGLASNVEEQNEVTRLLGGDMDEKVVFSRDGNSFGTNHELWSELFLVRLAKDAVGRQSFENCLNELSVDPYDESRGQFLLEIFEIGARRPKLTPLFGKTEESGINPPDSWSRQRLANLRGLMKLNSGELDDATDENEFVLEKTEDDSMEAAALGNLGLIEKRRGNLNKAEKYHKKSLELKDELNDIAGRATSFHNLGSVALRQKNYQNAKKYYEKSRNMFEEINHRSGLAACSENLGLIARNQENYAIAKKYHKKSLKLKKELDDAAGRATTLNNLGLIAQNKRIYSEAREYYKESLELSRGLGDTVGQAKSLNNLGVLAEETDDWDDAREKFEDAAAINDKIDDFREFLKTDRNAIRAHRELGNNTEALRRAHESLERIEKSDLDELDGHRQFREDVIDDLTD
ncbi:tetratricopeptide repeat protein [Halobaculum sp. MBLA0143]|uniref:tetratricopeptide repeat protein n=1 Tax=Halobaculum sp. MBLA0143 TaxID=3079933 RepID=UPI003525248F